MQRSKIDIWVGLFVMLGAAAMLFLALQAGNLLTISPRDAYQVRAEFQDIGGLKPQAAVKSSGVVVGRVNRIEFDNTTYQAVAVLDMDQKYHFPDDSMLKIMTSGLLGDQYIGIEAGYSDKQWADGAVIANTQSAVVLENLIGQLINSTALDSAKEDAAKGGAEADGSLPPSEEPASGASQ